MMLDRSKTTNQFGALSADLTLIGAVKIEIRCGKIRWMVACIKEGERKHPGYSWSNASTDRPDLVSISNKTKHLTILVRKRRLLRPYIRISFWRDSSMPMAWMSTQWLASVSLLLLPQHLYLGQDSLTMQSKSQELNTPWTRALWGGDALTCPCSFLVLNHHFTELISSQGLCSVCLLAIMLQYTSAIKEILPEVHRDCSDWFFRDGEITQ